MTGTPVEVVRECCDALMAQDEERLLRTLHPNVVQHGTRGGIDEGRVLEGPEVIVSYLRDVNETWERLDVEVEELIIVGDVVVARWRETAKSAHSEAEIQSEIAMLFTVREGKVTELRGYMDPEEALDEARAARGDGAPD